MCRGFENGTDARKFVFVPGLRLRHLGTNVERKQRRKTANPKHPSPSERRKNETRRDRGEQISKRVAALQESREHTAPASRRTFHGQRRANSPLAAHANS